MWNPIAVAVLLAFITGLYFFWKSRKRTVTKQSKDEQKTILIVIGSGGHTREMLCFVKALGERYQPRYYVIAETDKMSKTKVIDCEKESNVKILCNGPGTCIPICAGGLLLKWLHIQSTMTVYVESICRVKSLSLSGKLLYHFADSFIVQWPELTEIYPKAKYFGRLV